MREKKACFFVKGLNLALASDLSFALAQVSVKILGNPPRNVYFGRWWACCPWWDYGRYLFMFIFFYFVSSLGWLRPAWRARRRRSDALCSTVKTLRTMHEHRKLCWLLLGLPSVDMYNKLLSRKSFWRGLSCLLMLVHDKVSSTTAMSRLTRPN